jgi:hypothetical protein
MLKTKIYIKILRHSFGDILLGDRMVYLFSKHNNKYKFYTILKPVYQFFLLQF